MLTDMGHRSIEAETAAVPANGVDAQILQFLLQCIGLEFTAFRPMADFNDCSIQGKLASAGLQPLDHFLNACVQ